MSRPAAQQTPPAARAALLATPIGALAGVFDRQGNLATPGVIRNDANYAPAYLLLSELYALQGSPTAAVGVIATAQAVGQTRNNLRLVADATLRLQQARLVAQADPQAALQLIREALLINPYAIGLLRYQVELNLQIGQAGLAVLAAEEYLARYPGSAEAYRLRGDAYAAEGKDELAQVQYRRALLGRTDEATRARIHLALARLSVRLGDTKAALDDYEQAIALSPDPSLRAERLALAYRLGQGELARQDLAALREQEGLPQAKLDYWETLLGLRDGEDSVVLLPLVERALSSGLLDEAERAQALTAQAEILLAQAEQASNAAQALQAINEALALGQTGSRRYLRAQVYEALAQTRQRAEQRREDLARAREDYAFVLAWNSLYAYPFAPVAQARYNALGS